MRLQAWRERRPRHSLRQIGQPRLAAARAAQAYKLVLKDQRADRRQLPLLVDERIVDPLLATGKRCPHEHASARCSVRAPPSAEACPHAQAARPACASRAPSPSRAPPANAQPATSANPAKATANCSASHGSPSAPTPRSPRPDRQPAPATRQSTPPARQPAPPAPRSSTALNPRLHPPHTQDSLQTSQTLLTPTRPPERVRTE
jgi:hypothetical protein